MNTATIRAALASTAVAAVIGLGYAPAALADTTTLGSQGQLVNGAVVQGWTVKDLKPSTDVIAYPVHGVLWEATATDTAIAGTVTPIVSNFNARARNGDTYRVLFGAATAQGVNPATLAQGQQTTGKLYFDVTGAEPDSVVYNAGGPDLLVWITPLLAAPAESGAGSTRPTWTPGGTASGSEAPTTPSPAAEAPPAPGQAPAQPASTGAAPTVPAPMGSSGTPLPTGSQGTPIGSAGTPAGTPGQPLPPAADGSQGTPAGAATGPAPASAAPPVLPPAEAGKIAPAAPAGSQGTPAATTPVTTPVTPPPAA